jgi:hypothetical protein
VIAADILKLRRHRSTMATAALLSAGMAIIYFAFIEARHHGNLAGPQALSDGATLMGMYFGAFAAILVGTEAGSTDLASGVFRDLVATGRSRTALFGVRIPAAIAVTLPLTLSGYAVTVAAAYAFHGSAAAPSAGLAIRFAAWVALATIVQTTLAVGISSLTGSRSVTLITVIGWNTIATSILYGQLPRLRPRPGADDGARQPVPRAAGRQSRSSGVEHRSRQFQAADARRRGGAHSPGLGGASRRRGRAADQDPGRLALVGWPVRRLG